MRRPTSGWVPKQHGAWAMLLSPLLVGALAAGIAPVHLLLGAFWLCGYLAFQAAALWLKSRRRSRYRPPVTTYAAVATVLGIAVLLAVPRVVIYAPLFIAPLGIGLWSSARRTERSLLSGVAMTAGSTVMVLVAYDAGGGQDVARAVVLAVVQAAYFIGTVVYVKSCIRERGNARSAHRSVGYHALVTILLAGATLLGSWPVLSEAVVAVFVVLTVRAWWAPRLALTPAKIGLGEIAFTAAVAAVSLT